MRVESPFKGIPSELLGFVVGIMVMIAGCFLLVRYGFPSELVITLVWTIMGLILIALGFILVIISLVIVIIKGFEYQLK